ncbi:hypothetical protein KQI88_17680 [Alkaliphilus sp. MSJ-5]|uniref:Spiroplasmavirus-related protein n=1 Tax=Alkaliphilus flagellatus TaxID=2841507 RepID=A0ABS6G950_9FIRM|nr:hypothetical protein [Alkaliphilus flagellatus]MBU5678242.1 hypothetical protein [Alkaliphilus flagellatus]
MDYINFVWGMLVTLIILIVFINFWMKIANYIGEKFKIFFMSLLKKIRRHK